MTVHAIADDVALIAHAYAFPGEVTPLNATVVRAAQPLVVDTTAVPFRDSFMADLATVLAPAEVAYVAVTHADPDHTGALVALLAAAPRAQVLTNALGRTKLMGDFGLPAERFRLVNPGDAVDLGDRLVRVVSVPLFDQPETMGFFDERSRVLCTADCFGAVLPAAATYADEVAAAVWEGGFRFWNRANHPWVRLVDPAKLAVELDALRALGARAIVSAHGPAMRLADDIAAGFRWLGELPDS